MKTKKLPKVSKEKYFIVNTKEIWVRPYFVKARDIDEAIRRVEAGNGTVIDNGFEYSSTIEIGGYRDVIPADEKIVKYFRGLKK